METKMNALQFAALNVFGMVAEYETDADSLDTALANGWLVRGGRSTYDLTATGLTEAIARNYEIGVIVGIVKEFAA